MRRNFRTHLRAAGVLLLVVVLAACDNESDISHQAPPGVHGQPLEITTVSGTYRYAVEIADSPQKRSQGLMYRRQLAPDRGMLFLYRRDQPVSMWMRNTYVALDMIFIRADGVIHHVHSDAEPLSEALIRSHGDVRAVLEVNAGESARIGVKPGDMARHPLLNAGPER